MRARTSVVRCVLLGVALLPLFSCAVLTDLINPDFVVQAGLDPGSIFPAQGVVIVVFNNQTSNTAGFFGFSTASATDPSRDSRNFAVEVEPKSNKNEVVDCPVAVIDPGRLAADFSIDNTAAVVIDSTGAATAVAYTGPALLVGTSFNCGDVIEFRLDEVQTTTGTTTTQSFAITVRVIPGR
jgi:hypothetical protein